MKSLTPSMVTSNLSLQQPKIEINLFSPELDDLNLGPFEQLETQLLDSMEISEHQPSHSNNYKLEVFGDDYMEELDGNSEMLSSGDKKLACVVDMPPKWVKSQCVTDAPVLRRSSMARNAHNAPTKKLGLDKRLKHGDRLRKYIKENGKIPVIFRKKDGHPVGEYTSMFMMELGIAVKKFAPVRVSGWKNVTEEQKQPIFDQLGNAFVVDFGLGPVKAETDKLMSIRFRHYRRRMHEHYKTLAHLPWEERLKCVPKEYCESEADWEFMCKMFESDTFKKKSVINSGNRAKTKSSYIHRRGSNSLSRYRYDADDGSGEKYGTSSNETDNNPEKGCPGESVVTDDNNKQIGSDNQDDSSLSLEGADAVKRARHRVQESRAGYVAGPTTGIRPAKSTSSDDTSLIATNSELRNELLSTRIALQLAEDKIRILDANQKLLEETIQAKTRIMEANQKHLEEIVQANTRVMEANQQIMKQVFERIASDITQSLTQLPSSAPLPPRL